MLSGGVSPSPLQRTASGGREEQKTEELSTSCANLLVQGMTEAEGTI